LPVADCCRHCRYLRLGQRGDVYYPPPRFWKNWAGLTAAISSRRWLDGIACHIVAVALYRLRGANGDGECFSWTELLARRDFFKRLGVF
jgi:hypothetical protein